MIAGTAALYRPQPGAAVLGPLEAPCPDGAQRLDRKQHRGGMARVRPGQRIKQAETVAPTSPTKAMRLGPAPSLEGSRTSLIHLSQCPYQSSGASARSQNRRDDGDVVPRRRQRSGQEFQAVEGMDGGEHVRAFPDGSLETSPDELVTKFYTRPETTPEPWIARGLAPINDLSPPYH